MEVEDDKCCICKSKKLIRPYKNKECGHVACQTCWSRYREYESNKCPGRCGVTILDSNLVELKD